MEQKIIPNAVESIYKSWNLYRRVWWFVHYFVGILGIIASLTVANKPQIFQELPLVLNSIAWLSAICVGLLVFLEPRKRARAYTAAWRILHREIGKFRNDSENNAPNVLFDTITQGEEFISKLDG